MGDLGETLWSFFVLTVTLILIIALGAALFFLGTAVIFGAIPVGGLYYWYYREHWSSEALEKKERIRTYELYISVKKKAAVIDVADFLASNLNYYEDTSPNNKIRFSIASRLVAFERLDDFPPEPPELCNTIEGGRYRDLLNRVTPHDYQLRLEHICQLANMCEPVPSQQRVTDIMYKAVATLDDGKPLLPRLAAQINQNYKVTKNTKPQEYKGDDYLFVYLHDTPLLLIENMVRDDTIDIPDDIRNQHHMIIAGTGHGKTQCLQQMLVKDFEDDDACVIVIDSQGGMLEKLLHIVSWDRVAYLDGGNIYHPLALSAFSIGSTTKPEDEPKVRTAVALYEHMFAVRETALTANQSTMYRFLSRFLMVIPKANFDTALAILNDGYEQYAAYADQLDETSRTFVTTHLCDPRLKYANQAYRLTRQEVSRRLFTLMESRTLKGMFNAPTSKVNIPDLIRKDKIILINTAQSVLGDEGAQLFGKYCFAQIAMEVLARPETRKRIYLYLDEAHEYLSDSPIIRRLYEQGRKRGLCMVTANQSLEQLEKANIDRMLFSLTSIKFAGGVSSQDAAKLAKEMDLEADFIRSMPPLTFAAWVKHHDTGLYKVQYGTVEDQIDEYSTDNEVSALKQMMIREFHYNPHKETEQDTPPPDEPDQVEDSTSDPTRAEIDPDAPQPLD